MRAGKKVSSTDGGDRDVVDGRVARLEDSEGARRLKDGLAGEDGTDVPGAGFEARGPGVIPD
jgi:hypothetical protein